jgi:spore coat protein SA
VRICHVAPELLPVPPDRGGAIERWIRDAARRLAARGHEVHVVSRDHGDGATERSLDGVQYHFIRIPSAIDRGRGALAFRGWYYFSRAARVVGRLRPDVVHHHSRPAALYLTARSSPRSRQLISLHSMQYGWSFGYTACDRVLFRPAFRACARALCVSDFIQRHTVAAFPEVASKATTLYNGVDGDTFHPSQTDGSSGNGATILYVGRVEARKGVHVLLDAFEGAIKREAADARLRIVGPHSYWDATPSAFYSTLAGRCRQDPRVDLLGPTYVDADLAAVYRSADVSVVPSVFPEALGLTSLEAQASGVPVVVSDAGGLPETVLPGESGVVVRNGDADALASSILALLADRKKLRTMGGRARAWAMERFSWDTIASQLEAEYARVA